MPSTALSAIRTSIHTGSNRYSSGQLGQPRNTTVATINDTAAAMSLTWLAVMPPRDSAPTIGRSSA